MYFVILSNMQVYMLIDELFFMFCLGNNNVVIACHKWQVYGHNKINRAKEHFDVNYQEFAQLIVRIADKKQCHYLHWPN